MMYGDSDLTMSIDEFAERVIQPAAKVLARKMYEDSVKAAMMGSTSISAADQAVPRFARVFYDC